ncbi:MAG: hypothetical protein WBO10_09045 [Pyrinomonadaceae bacterium]
MFPEGSSQYACRTDAPHHSFGQDNIRSGGEVGVCYLVSREFGSPFFQDLFWHGVSETKGDELCKAFIVKVRKITTTVPESWIFTFNIRLSTHHTKFHPWPERTRPRVQTPVPPA